ncbi:hypothetical protein DFP72DRAFT_1078386 [Ephemerocybe angulata]|uniref:Uncharacterized protein n=1 Tax=Ephemerocybe angulata TaxID=980116 RepID=A0A8H6HE89_9AGAR|nr:hypothetical protein DFP72DRAFT_1078386 [Tulosesus angulatus]
MATTIPQLESPTIFPSFLDELPEHCDTNTPSMRLFTLESLVQTADWLHINERDKDLALLVGCGVGNDYHALLNLSRNHMYDRSARTVTRFYGAIIGVSENIAVRGTDLLLLQDLSGEQSIRDNCYTYHTWSTSECSFTAPLHTIPNTGFATFEDGNSIGILLPGLYDDARKTHHIKPHEYRIIWDCVIIPAIAELVASGDPVCFTSLSHSANQDQDTTLARLPSDYLPYLSEAIRRHANSTDVPWLHGLSFVHVVPQRSSLHGFSPDASQATLLAYLSSNHISVESINDAAQSDDTWIIEVGVEVNAGHRCAVWAKDYHSVVYEALTGETLDTHSFDYRPRMISHLTDAAGFHMVDDEGIEKRLTGQPTVVDLYSTDPKLKAITEHGGPIETPTGLDIIRRKYKSMSFLEDLARGCLEGARPVSSRATVRRSLHLANKALLNIDTNIISDACLIFATDVLWKWRAYRAYAFDYFIEEQREHPEGLSIHHQNSLLVTAAIAWLLQSFFTADMDLYATFRYPASHCAGAVFLEEVSGYGLGRGSWFDMVEPHHYLHERDIIRDLGDNVSAAVHAFKVRQYDVHGPRPPRPAPDGQPVFQCSTPIIEHPGTRIAMPYVYHHPDISLGERRPDFLEDEALCHYVNEVTCSFITDILQLAPSTKDGISSILPNFNGSSTNSLDVGNRDDLGNIFRQYQWKHATYDEWTRAFDILFPPHGVNSSRYLEYRGSAYYRRWQQLSLELSDTMFRMVRAAVWETVFRSLYWIPSCHSDSIWSVTPDPHYIDSLALDVGSVKILINGQCGPV